MRVLAYNMRSVSIHETLDPQKNTSVRVVSATEPRVDLRKINSETGSREPSD